VDGLTEALGELEKLPTTGRERPRDPDEARLLRRIGTPE
jgi:hypothetical protein